MRNAVLFDFGGVILPGPFEAFRAFEERRGLPEGFIRRVNSTNPHDNAWARLERSEVDLATFDGLFAEESAALGHRIGGAEVMAMFQGGDPHPEMVALVARLRGLGYRIGGITNDIRPVHGAEIEGSPMQRARALMDVVVASSEVGLRKPDPRIYEMACSMLGVTPHECVFLDDLGVNLKPAAAMGMATIKVLDVRQAIDDLLAVLGLAG